MEIEMKMPDLGTTQDEITLTGWLVAVGQPVRRGEALLEVETDKAAMEVESFATGVLKEVRAEPGDEVAAGQVIAIIEAEGAPAAAAPAPVEDRPPAPAAEASPAQPAGAPAPKKAGGMFARNRQAAAQAGDQPQGPPLSPAQRTVAKRMLRSKQTIPHFYLQASADAEAMVTRRGAAAPKKIVWDAFFVRAVGKALQRFERMRCRFEAGGLVPQETDAVGAAVDVDGDLFVVPVAGAASKEPERISDEITAAVERLRGGDLEARAVGPTNITITNLGVANVESFAAIINPPESAILAVGKVAPAAVVDDGRIVARNRVSLTLSVDHRVAGGRYAAEFLGAIIEQLQTV